MGNSRGPTEARFAGTSSTASRTASSPEQISNYILKDKNTILILQIEPKKFSEALWNARYFTLVMPGNVSNLSLSFESKGGSMLTSLAECVKQNETRYKNFKPSLEKVPDAVKEQL